MTKRMMMVFAVLLAMGMTVAACGGTQAPAAKDSAGTGAQPGDAGTGSDAGAPAAAEMEATVVTKDSFAYEPAEMTAKAGQKIKLTLDNSAGTLEHSYVLTKKGVDKDTAVMIVVGDNTNVQFEMGVQPGAKATEEFTAPAEAGEYIVVCHIAGHAPGGMVGKLTVQ